jgi:hypothetical protein
MISFNIFSQVRVLIFLEHIFRYKEGMLKAKSDDQETIQLIEGAAAGKLQ